MTAVDVLAEARAAGLTVEARGDRLAVKGLLTPELRARLVAEKAAVLALLRAGASADPDCSAARDAWADRQREVLRLWTTAHERRRAACGAWPLGGYALLTAERADLEAAIAQAERDADELTTAFRDGAAPVEGLHSAIAAWLAAHERAAAWLGLRGPDRRPPHPARPVRSGEGVG